MQTPAQIESISNLRLWTGLIVTGLVVLFLAFDGVTKVLQVAPVVKASEKLGLPGNCVFALGVLLLACTTTYCVPKTAVLGAVLLTGYLGGAVAVQLGAKSGAFSIGFPAGFGVLLWVALALREPRLVGWILLRQ